MLRGIFVGSISECYFHTTRIRMNDFEKVRYFRKYGISDDFAGEKTERRGN